MSDERILVVDDEPLVAQMCAMVLAGQGYQVRQAYGGQDALALLEVERFDLILVDLKMPGVNGLTVLRRAKELDPHVAAIMITSYGTMENAIESLRAGAQDFFLKPFELDELLGVVEKVLAAQRQEQENRLLRAQLPILEICQALLAVGDLDSLAARLVETVVQQLRAEQALLLLLDEATGRLSAVAAIGLPHEVVGELWIPAGEGVAGQAMRRKGLLLMGREASQDPLGQAFGVDQDKALVCAPLRVGEKVVGLFVVGCPAGVTSLSSTDLNLLSIVTGQMATALENARLYSALAQSQIDWEATFDAMSDLVMLLDDQYHIRRMNRAMANRLGLAPQEAVGQLCYEVVHGVTMPPSFCPHTRLLADGQKHAVEIYEKRLESDLFVEVSPLHNDAGQLTGSVHLARDITARKRAEEEIRRRNRDLALLNRVIAASASAAVQGIKPTLETVCRELALAFDAPQAAAALFNEEKTEAVVVAEYLTEGRPPALGEIIPVLDNPASQYLLERKAPLVIEDAQTDPRQAPIRDLLRRRGAVSLLLLPLIVEGEVVGTLGIDAIERRAFTAEEVALAQRVAEQVSGVLAHARLEETRQRLSTAVEQAAESIIITDADGAMLYVNPAFERTSGYDHAEVLGRNPRILKSNKHDSTFYRELWETITAGQVWQGRFINKRKDGALYTEEATIAPIYNQAGEIVNYVAVKRDVTREMELEEQFRQAQKMEALGRLAGGIAHDFNNLLTVILLSTHLMERQLRPEDPLWEHKERIRETSQRAVNLVKQLLSFSRQEVVDLQALNLNQVVGDMSRMLQRIIGEDIALKIVLAEDLWPVEADPSQVDQVIANLAVNARDAMPEGGSLIIETANVVLDETYVARHVDARPGEHVLLTVSDTGVGMSDEVKAHLFEPFFTTKSRDKGTGLGLATVYGIVRQNGGHIRVYSEVGLGTAFKIYLPRASATSAVPGAKPAFAPPSEAPNPEHRGTETILLVEDEANVRELATRILQTHGYRVLAARDGEEALQLGELQGGPVHLLLTDVVMPGMSGPELAERLRPRWPGMRVLYMSGYTDEAVGQRSLLAQGAAFLAKPFSLEAITEEVRAALDVGKAG